MGIAKARKSVPRPSKQLRGVRNFFDGETVHAARRRGPEVMEGGHVMKSISMALLTAFLLVLTACGGDSQSAAAGRTGDGMMAGNGGYEENRDSGSGYNSDYDRAGTNGVMPEDSLADGARDVIDDAGRSVRNAVDGAGNAIGRAMDGR